MKKYKIKKVLIFTTSRSDFGLLKLFIKKIRKNKNFKTFLAVTGSHLEKKKGYTIKEIKETTKIDFRINLSLTDDTSDKILQSMSKFLLKLNMLLNKIKPSIIVILGDRFELIPICYSALMKNIPIAHFNGGELTEGLIDDPIRHATTKLSHIHFVANEVYKKRVINMGENPSKVFNIGGTSIDNIKKVNLLTRKDFEKKFNINLLSKNILITYHPLTLNLSQSYKEINNLLSVLKTYKSCGLIFTGNNIDKGNELIIKKIKSFIRQNQNSFFIESMGHSNYISALNICDLIIGNSSSGILEAPYFKKPIINIGNRQGGRVKAKCVIDCDASEYRLRNIIHKCLQDKYKNTFKKIKNPYGTGNASNKAIKILEKINFKELTLKKFYEKN